MRSFLAAVQFLTRVPVRLPTAPTLAPSVVWFPLVGGLVGALVGGVAAGMMEVVPPAVAAGLAVVVGMIVTGAFHEDGLADTADALGGWSPEQRREILQDPRHGSFGVAALCSSIVVRVLCLASLTPAAVFGGAVAAHAIGRGTSVVAMGWAPPMPGHGLGADLARAVSRLRAAVALVVALVVGGLAIGWWALPAAGAALLAGAVLAVLATRAFDGISGDVLGAIEQVGEVAVLVVVTGLATRHDVWWS